jgi:PDZ domain-containing secreted protein
MINYFKNFFKTFKDRKISFKISFVLLILLWIFIMVITLVPLNYEMTTPGVYTKTTSDVLVLNGNNRGNVYTLGVYGKRKLTIL